ncbi:hypothetical protein EUGRSUZ_L02590 [Eucalyptus grandis]|uniref:Uncharacterized protein n=1 Tax=Eucalyptus grandis TaxID=71139 RepID=A0AAD9WIT5_EUCGR|nr:hypothetical protein EUGRSUZ_L02590 [Eucalyptus grandis]
MGGSSFKVVPREENSKFFIMKFWTLLPFSKQTVAIILQLWHSIPRNLPRKKRNEKIGGVRLIPNLV